MGVPEQIVHHLDVWDGGRVQVVCNTYLKPPAASSLRARIGLLDEVRTARIDPAATDVTRIIVRPKAGVRGSALLALLREELKPHLSTNVVMYTTVLAQPSKTADWITAIGFAFLEPVTEAERDRFAGHMCAGYATLIGPTTVVYTEDKFFVLSAEGGLNPEAARQGIYALTIAEEVGVNISLETDCKVADAPNNTVDKFARRIRTHSATL